MAVVDARMCAPGSDPCPYVVQSALSCGCPIRAGNKTELDRIKAQWDAAGCTPGISCPGAPCTAPPASAVCVPNDSGDWCVGTNPTS